LRAIVPLNRDMLKQRRLCDNLKPIISRSWPARLLAKDFGVVPPVRDEGGYDAWARAL